MSEAKYKKIISDSEFKTWNSDTEWECSCDEILPPCINQFRIDNNIKTLDKLINYIIISFIFIGTWIFLYSLNQNIYLSLFWTISIYILSFFTLIFIEKNLKQK